MKNTKNKEIVEIEIFPNPFPERDYTIDMECPEFTCLCPKTGQPDFATLYISYVPDKKCIELKSLKIYLTSYRNEGGFHEKVINIILDNLVSACKPRKMTIIGDFNVRGGIHTTVTVEHSAKTSKSGKSKK
ncbi:MAG: NADPH-dependent 7-cyano-7-deazaguanine reductase QueF [Nitrospinae bacterium]|nr:NADPH-dependent 7-cyano-7-deazaguanine reductase QueF [Nitrospinota bacterium]